MALIASPRHTAADMAAWQRAVRLDRLLAGSPRLDRLAARSLRVLEDFCSAGPCHVSVSWGRDSVIVAHLAVVAAEAGRIDPAAAPLAHARPDRMDNPDCAAVRDAFLARWPWYPYQEHVFSWRVPLRGEPGWDRAAPARQDGLAETLNRQHGGRRVTGVRAAEGPGRELAMAVHGDATARTCRPAGWWSTGDVFAWAARHDLPVHPAYAMSRGGLIRRDRLRVHWLGTAVGDLGWELDYYGDVFARESAAPLLVLEQERGLAG